MGEKIHRLVKMIKDPSGLERGKDSYLSFKSREIKRIPVSQMLAQDLLGYPVTRKAHILEVDRSGTRSGLVHE
jgi:hypothetical protein